MLNNEFLREITLIRRRLHQVPEIAFDLYKTHEIVKEYLLSYGYDIEVVAKTGIIAFKKGKEKGALAFRADMDGLSVTEVNDVDYKSIHQGKMHACGHDGHMAILLGFAKYLSSVKKLNKDILLIFQPAEEGPGGAKNIIEEGILKKYNVEGIFGIHIFPGLEQGKIGLANGPLMAQSGEIDLTIRGKSAHGAQPHKGADAIVAASALVLDYQTILSRKIDPLEPRVLTIGTINGGDVRNIIAGNVFLCGTIRTFSSETYDLIKEKIKQVNSGIENIYEVQIDMEIRDFYPPVINDNRLFQIVKSSLDPQRVEIVKPLMLAEDFSFYQQQVPGLFMLLGSKNEEKGFIHPLHNGAFNFDEEILLLGVETYIKICQRMNVF
ncbi:hippurate hydrolase [Anaerobranca californiensis DSM 14826]|uniref:Hippurate hydrolase n=1 Tax=Anaerobranca californiensis DSM 14826 TaxID=1120989 RepID=A0A1M6RVL7_9FIRM|nr:M20 family metallopeptidase [Anaerobranca californiensis]SHK36536.1 hippurate hydrolase [Anaerobranca californiensis DSM 14826]